MDDFFGFLFSFGVLKKFPGVRVKYNISIIYINDTEQYTSKEKGLQLNYCNPF